MILKIHISLFLFCVTCQLSRSHPIGVEDVSQNEQQIISSLTKRFAEDKAETIPARQVRRGNSHFSNHPPLEENLNIPVVVVYDDVKVVQHRRSKSTVTTTTPKTDSVTSVVSNERYVESNQSTISTGSTFSKEDITSTEKNDKTNSSNALPQVDVTINTENIKKSKIELKGSNEATIKKENIPELKVEPKIEVSKETTITKEHTTATEKITKTATEKNVIKAQSTTVPRQVRQKQIPVVVVQDINENTNNIKLKTSFDAGKSSSNNTLPQIDVTVTENIKESKVELNSSNKETKNEENKKDDKKIKVTATNTLEISHNDKITKNPDRHTNKHNNEDNHKNATETPLESGTRKSKRIRQKDPIVPIVESTNFLFAQTGKFEYSYEGGDGTKAFESGKLKEFDEDRTGEAVVGGFSYKDKEGNDFAISYTADENGYRPVGAHLPTPPPIPPAIARALAYLATKTTPKPATESIKEVETTTISEIDEDKINI